MSQDFEDTKRAIWTTFAHVLRTSALKDASVSMQPLMIVSERTLAALGPEGPFDLSPMLEALREQGLEEEGIFEALLAFHDREEQLEFPIKLPREVEQLPKDKKHQLLLRYQKRQRGTRTAAPPPETTNDPAPRAIGAGAAAEPARTGPRPAIIIAFLVTLVVAGGLFAWRQSSRPQESVPVVIEDPGALPCAELRGNQGKLLCRISAADRAGLSPAELQKRGEATKKAAQGLGYSKVIVVQQESGKLVASF